MLKLFSPAKINLFLRIASKRTDGYHNLSSIFQTLSFGDTLTIEHHDRDVLTCTDPSLPIDDSNLILKATELFRQKTGLNHFYKIHLLKRIPIQAGLGGGSSNAATILWACNQLAETRIALKTLKQWGGEIGSDVPFFFSQGTAHCTGRGEHVYCLPQLPQRPLLRPLWIVKPSFGLSTPEVYRRFRLSAPISEANLQSDLDNFLAGTFPCFNDLESPAFEIKPELKEIKNTLVAHGFETVLMSGSGSAFFCMGTGKVPQDPQLTVYPAQFHNRPLDHWY